MMTTNTLKSLLTTSAFLATAIFGTAALADDKETVDHTEVGSLSCDVGDRTGFILAPPAN